MKKRSWITNFENLELHHKILSFLIILIVTILITRFIIYYIGDPNPLFFGLELHHFDYGLIILTITSLLLLLGKKHFKLYLIMLAISLGLIIDELWFIRKQIGGNNPEIYNPSLIYVLIVAVFVSLIALLISYFSNKRNK